MEEFRPSLCIETVPGLPVHGDVIGRSKYEHRDEEENKQLERGGDTVGDKVPDTNEYASGDDDAVYDRAEPFLS